MLAATAPPYRHAVSDTRRLEETTAIVDRRPDTPLAAAHARLDACSVARSSHGGAGAAERTGFGRLVACFRALGRDADASDWRRASGDALAAEWAWSAARPAVIAGDRRTEAAALDRDVDLLERCTKRRDRAGCRATRARGDVLIRGLERAFRQAP